MISWHLLGLYIRRQRSKVPAFLLLHSVSPDLLPQDVSQQSRLPLMLFLILQQLSLVALDEPVQIIRVVILVMPHLLLQASQFPGHSHVVLH